MHKDHHKKICTKILYVCRSVRFVKCDREYDRLSLESFGGSYSVPTGHATTATPATATGNCRFERPFQSNIFKTSTQLVFQGTSSFTSCFNTFSKQTKSILDLVLDLY